MCLGVPVMLLGGLAGCEALHAWRPEDVACMAGGEKARPRGHKSPSSSKGMRVHRRSTAGGGGGEAARCPRMRRGPAG